MVETILLIAQVSSVLTALAGIFASYIMFKAAKYLVKGEFRKTILISAVFLLLATIGVSTMAGFHVSQSFTEQEPLEDLWYIFMFAALLFSLYESYQIVLLGKQFSSLEKMMHKFKHR